MISYQEFAGMPPTRQAEILLQLKEANGVKKILEAWDIPRDNLYTIMKELGVPIRQRKQSQSNTGKQSEKTERRSAQKNNQDVMVPEAGMQTDSTSQDMCEMRIQGNASVVKELLAHIFAASKRDNTTITVTFDA